MNRCIMVLGMHRTGTSTVAGVLHHLGVVMGRRLMPPTDDNPKGYFEDEDFYEVNQKLMDSWKAEQVYEPGPEILNQYKALVGERLLHQIWGMKDPRLCITAKHIVPFIQDVRVILTHRTAIDCISSMMRRYSVTHQQGAETIHRFLNARSEFMEKFIGPAMNVHYEGLLAETEKVVKAVANFAFYDMEKPSDEQIAEAVKFVDPKLNREERIRKEANSGRS